MCPLWLLPFVSFACKNFCNFKKLFSKTTIAIPFHLLRVCLLFYLLCYLYLRLMFCAVIFMFHSFWWGFPLFEFWHFQEIFKSISLAKEHALCDRYEHSDDPWRINIIDSSGRFHSALQLHVQPQWWYIFFFWTAMTLCYFTSHLFPVVKAKNTSGLIIDDISCRGPFAEF